MNPQQTLNQNGVPGQPTAGQPAGYVAMPGQTYPQAGQAYPNQPGQPYPQNYGYPGGAQPYPAQGYSGQVSPQMPGQGTPANMTANAPMQPVRKENPRSTQGTLLISELRDNVVIMKDGSFRAVVACKSINFDLMSDAEREGVEYSYQSFLNSLTFTTQILVRSQRVDIGPYLDRLIEIRRNNDNMLLGVLMDNYIDFVDALAQEANIMDKLFFIVIPYYSSPDLEQGMQQTKNFFKTFSRSKIPEVTRIDRATYDKAMGELNNRVEVVMSGLFDIGVQAVRLKTKELAELYYNYNNPDTAVREPLVDFSRVATMYVSKAEPDGQAPRR